MSKILNKIIEYCDKDCPYYELDYSDSAGDFAICNHEEGKNIYNHNDLHITKEETVSLGSFKQIRKKYCWNDELFPIIPPKWCPLEDVKNKEEKDK